MDTFKVTKYASAGLISFVAQVVFSINSSCCAGPLQVSRLYACLADGVEDSDFLLTRWLLRSS